MFGQKLVQHLRVHKLFCASSMGQDYINSFTTTSRMPHMIQIYFDDGNTVMSLEQGTDKLNPELLQGQGSIQQTKIVDVFFVWCLSIQS